MDKIPAIETRYDGRRFRSRTEARWAVFFNALGWAYEYEREGVVLPSGPYLPDFWLPGIGRWLEVKGSEPTPREVRLCEELAQASGSEVLLAIGGPEPRGQIIWFGRDDPEIGPDDRFYFLADRRDEEVFWLMAHAGHFATAVGPSRERSDHDRAPVINAQLKAAYDAASSARFEHGERG
jgi:hypothetical protein